MERLGTVTWRGRSYQFDVYDIDDVLQASLDELPKVPGIYIFVRQGETKDSWTRLYIGESGDLWCRIKKHNQLECVIEEGGTHIHVRVHDVDDKDQRECEEGALLEVYIDRFGIKPPCHDQ